MIEDRDSYRKARRKTKVITLTDTDEQIEIVNLNAAGYRAMIEAQREHKGDNIMRTMTVVKWGVPAFSDLTVEEVLDTVYLEDAMTLQLAIMELSGTDEDSEKKS